ncbi:ESX secretion-associated protein EspG [Longimycelium tulufanense]|uniref:ESX secretion-associated protein EspG n=2 Tax=Longimycelium tulufanense TaxID=907463 RepID=A0A8J3C9N2_9PSEU|nr:ESX secretion-associated protein EspG [Longimycelium tulufanense]
MVLTWPEYDFLWEYLRLGPYPVVLTIDGHGRTVEEREELRQQAWQSLWERGFGRPGDLDPDLADRLAILARPEWEVDARLHIDPEGPRVSGLAASVGEHGVLARLDTRHLSLSRVPASGLARAVVSLLPPHPPGTGRSITLPAETLDVAAQRAGENARILEHELAAEGLDSKSARKIAEVLGNTIRFGQFGAARTPRHGTRQRASHVVTFYDDPRGRYLFSRRPGNGRAWCTLVPGDARRLVQQVSELVAELDDWRDRSWH